MRFDNPKSIALTSKPTPNSKLTMFLAFLFLPMSGALSATLLLNITDSGHTKPVPGNFNLQLDPFPNPFPIPGTGMTIEWHQHHDLDDLPKADVQGAFQECKTRAETHVLFVGDGPIPDLFYAFYGSVVVIFRHGIGVSGVMLYSEVSDILMAMSWVVSREGYREMWVRVTRTDGGQDLGSVSVSET